MNTLDAMRSRRSIRVYRDQPVERAHIQVLLEAAMAAPSACNTQPWAFIVVDEPDGMDSLRQCIGASNGRTYNAPAAIVVCENTRYVPWETHGCNPDCAAAIENMLLAVTELGLGAVWIGDFDPEKTAAQLKMPEHVRTAGIVLFGHPAEEKTSAHPVHGRRRVLAAV